MAEQSLTNQPYHSRFTESTIYTCLEDLEESSLEMCLLYCGIEQCHPLHIFQRPRNEYVLHVVLSGKGTYSANGKSWELGKGQMFLIPPNRPYTYVADAQDPWMYAWIGFNGMLSERIMYMCGFSEGHLFNELQETDFFVDYVRRMIACRELTMANDLRRNGLLLELLSRLVEIHASEIKTPRPETSAQRTNIYVTHAIEYIRSYYSQDISVQSIADKIGISRTHLNNCFQKELGLSIQKFLIDFRLHKAANLLVSSTDTVQIIANRVGYPDPHTFSKAFKKKFNLSPKDYRTKKKTLDFYDEKQMDEVAH